MTAEPSAGPRGEPVSPTARTDDDADVFCGTPFRKVRRLQSGGMGDVYLVLHRDLARRFVAKVLRHELLDDARTVDRVRLEAELLARLRHPNIVGIQSWHRLADGRPFLVMEWLRGVTVADELASRGVPSLRATLCYARQLLSALGAAHALGVVHRDIKPQNLFLHQRADGEVVLKVLDFGVARILPEASSLAPSPLELPTETGTVLGTPRFVSPEGAAGGRVDLRADLYAAGLVLYALLTGRGPFDHQKRLGDVLDAHLHEAPSPPSAHAPFAIPAELDRVVVRSLAKSPDARFQSAAEFEAALVRAIEPGVEWPAARRSSEPGPPRAERPQGTPGSPPERAGAPETVSARNASPSTPAAPRSPTRAGAQLRPLVMLALFLGSVLLMSLVGAGGTTWLGHVLRGAP